MSIRYVLTPALIAGLLAAAPVMAQTTPPAAPSVAATTPAPAAMAGKTRRDAMVERRITELHAKLKITPAEEKPFGDFAQAMRDNAQHMDEAAAQRRANAETATAVEQMKAYATLAQSHADEVSHLVTPFSTLYETLSPDQKKMADQSFRDFSQNPRSRVPG